MYKDQSEILDSTEKKEMIIKICWCKYFLVSLSEFNILFYF